MLRFCSLRIGSEAEAAVGGFAEGVELVVVGEDKGERVAAGDLDGAVALAEGVNSVEGHGEVAQLPRVLVLAQMRRGVVPA